MMNGTSIVLFKTELETLNLFSDQMEQRFRELGYDVFTFDIRESVQSLGRLYEYMKNHTISAMIGFNSNVFGMKTPSGANVWDTLGIFCINILVDHPYWYHKILSNMPTNSAVLCVDRNHMKYVNRFYPNIAINGFLPHGGTFYSKGREISQRENDLLYAGSYYLDTAEDLMPDFSAFEFDAKKISEESVDYLIEYPDSTIESVLEQMLINNDIHLEDSELRRFISSNVYVERIVSSYYRERLIGTLANEGLNLTIYGSGWDKCSWISKSNVSYKGMVSPGQALSKMQESKIVINSMPWFKDGSHERIFNGMLSGNLVVTEKNNYLSEIFSDDSIIFYKLKKEKDLAAQLYDFLGKTKTMQSMCDKAFDIAKDNTWATRAFEIHEFLQEIGS